MMSKKTKLFLPVITGLTASGKSELALAVVGEFAKKGTKCEIVCCDSMLVYKGMDIGTAKPKESLQKELPHHCINLVNPDESFDVGDYVREAKKVIQDITKRNAIPLLVGGSGLYLRALTKGLLPLPESESEELQEIRLRLKDELKQKEGPAILRKRLEKIDPVSFQTIHPNDHYRIVRALEVYELTGKPLGEMQKEHSFQEEPYQTKMVALKWPREKLYERIHQRIDQMIQEGLEKEVRSLLQKGYSPDLHPMKGLAYRHFVQKELGNLSKEEALNLTKRDSRHFAKRQATWFRPLKEIHFLLGSNPWKIIGQETFSSFKTFLP